MFSDRQFLFPNKISDNAHLDTGYLVPSMNPDFKVYMGCVWYDETGSETTTTNNDRVVLRKIKIEVRRSKDNYLLLSMPFYMVRNGVY